MDSKMNKLLLGAMTLLMLTAAGCSGDSSKTEGTTGATDTTGTTGTAASGKTLKLAFVTNNSSDFWTIARKGVEKADEELANVEAEFRMPTEGTAANQTQVVDDLLAKGVDGMAISPVDPANETDLLNKAAGQALVFTQDSDAPNSNRACYVGTDNVAAGRQAGEELKKALPNGGKVYAFVGSIDAQNAKDRLSGIKEALQGSNITLVDTRADGTDRAKAKSNVADVLVKDPDVAGLVGIWSYNGPGILNAVKDAGKVGKVKIVCFDEEDETLAGVKDGSISATIVQQPYEFGYQAIKMMAAYLGGDKSVIPANKLNIVPTKVITSAGVDEFKTNLMKLRGK
jgi:ribose transport system substrate-binding protein